MTVDVIRYFNWTRGGQPTKSCKCGGLMVFQYLGDRIEDGLIEGRVECTECWRRNSRRFAKESINTQVTIHK